jgi:Mg-chelatase subunit ChlD
MNALRFISLVPALLVALSPASRAQSATDALTREREEQTGTAITNLFDNSGSMKGEKLRQAKAAFSSWLQTVPEDYKYSLITFEDQGFLAVPLGEHTRDTIAKRVARLEANTSTPICGALRIAREQIEKRRRDVTPYERNVVLIFTDGQETVDPRGVDGVRADILALRKKTVEIVGVGFHNEGDYMNGVATRFALANNEQELKQGLAKVDAEIGSVDDLLISDADLAALKTFNAAPVLPIATVAVEQTEPDPAPAPVPPISRRSPGFGWLVIAFIFWIAMRVVFRGKKKVR